MIAILIVIITAIVSENAKPHYVITDVKITAHTELTLKGKPNEN